MDNLPFVSIIVPVLNCVTEIEPCVDALSRQDYPKNRFEIIIVDNGSRDGSLSLLKKLRVKFLLCPARGRASALNLGLRHAHGEVICTTDISCRAEPNWVRTIVDVFKEPSIGCVAGEIVQQDKQSNQAIEFQRRINYMSPLFAANRQKLPALPYADGANASFRKIVFDKVGPFESNFYKAADVEICYRLLILTDLKIAFCKEAVVSEPAEPTMTDLLRQRYRIGLGHNLMRRRFPQIYREKTTKIGTVKRFVWRLSEYRAAIKETSLTDQIRIAMMNRAQSLGKHLGKFKVPATVRPIFPDAESTFIASLPDLRKRIVGTDEVSIMLR